MADAGNKWYVLKAVSGKEAKVKEYIEAEMMHNDLLAANVSQVLILQLRSMHLYVTVRESLKKRFLFLVMFL